MTQNESIQFDNELKLISQGIYKGNENVIPKDWIMLEEFDNKETGFYGKAFYKSGKIVLAFRGTELTSIKDINSDRQMAYDNLPNQYVDAKKFYRKIKKDFPNYEIMFTGHSLGGSLAQLMSNYTGNDAVTFNAYGVANLLYDNEIKNTNIRNYGNANDLVFNANLDNQLGKTYIIDDWKISGDYVSKKGTDNYGKLYPVKNHFIETMGNLEDALEYKKSDKILKGSISYNVNKKDIDTKRIFTNEEIGKMSKEEFERNEDFIHQQINLDNVMTKAEADEKIKSGEVIWVDDYVRSDGTHVSGYYRRK